MKVLKKDKDKVQVELEIIEYDLIQEYLEKNNSSIQENLREKYFNVDQLNFSNDYSTFIPRIIFFKNYSCDQLFEVLKNKFYLKNTAKDSYDYIYNSYTFKSHIAKSNIRPLKITGKLVKYNYLEVVRELKFKISDEEIQSHIVSFKDLTSLNTKELSNILSVTEQTIYNLKNKMNLPFKLEGKTARYNLYELIAIFQVN